MARDHLGDSPGSNIYITDKSKSNNPPSPIDFAKEVIGDLSGWMSDHPVVESEEDSRDAKLLLDRAKAALEDVERERVAKVKPLNDQVTEINGVYKAAHNIDPKKPGTLDRVVASVLKQRMQAYLLVEESKRRRIAEEKQAAADAAREAALLAEKLEKEAIANAAVGEIGIDVAAVTQQADEAFVAFGRADREAERASMSAERVRLSGGFGRSVSVRSVEVLEVKDACAALVDMGLTDGVRDAILTSARAYRTATGDLPAGISASFERKL